MAFLQQITHTSGVVFVHLATVGFNVQLLAQWTLTAGAVSAPQVLLCFEKGADYTQIQGANLGVRWCT